MDKVKQFFSNRNRLYAAYAFVVIAVASVVVVFVLRSERDDDEPKDFSSEETEIILSEIIKNNADGLVDEDLDYDYEGGENYEISNEVREETYIDRNNPLNRSSIPVPVINNIGEAVPLTEEDLPTPDLDVYNYRISKVTEIPGNASNSCESYMVDQTNTREYYEYFDAHRSFYKHVAKDQDGDISHYNLGKYGDDINEYTDYIDGSFAAKSLFQIDPNFSNDHRLNPPSYPVSYGDGQTQDEINVRNYFGSNASITGVEEVEGKTYYEVTVTHFSNCALYPENDYKTVIFVHRVDADNFNILSTKMYVDTIDEANRVFTRTTDTQRNKATYEEVIEVFTFEHDVNIKAIDYASYEYDPEVEYARTIEHLESTGRRFLFPDLSGVDMKWFYGKDFPERVENERYYLLREYYPSNEKGEKRYQDMMNDRAEQPEISAGYHIENYDRYLYIDSYDSSNTIDQIFGRLTFYFDREDITQWPIELNVNGNLSGADKRTVRFLYPQPYPASYPISYPVSYPYQSAYFTNYAGLNLNGQVYMITSHHYSDDFIERQDYLEYSINNAGANVLRQEIHDVFSTEYYHYCGV